MHVIATYDRKDGWSPDCQGEMCDWLKKEVKAKAASKPKPQLPMLEDAASAYKKQQDF